MFIKKEKFTYDKFRLYSGNIFEFYLNPKLGKIGVLDIETTGLSPQKSKFILGGLLIFEEDGISVRQYFAESPKEEPEILSEFLKDVRELDTVVTYNGKHFDINFLKVRMAELGIFRDYTFPYNLDLYLVLNGYSSVKKFVPNLKQKTVENFMGLWESRTDEISGKESVDMYYRYVSTKDTELRRIIMLHNSDDIMQLAQLIPVLAKCDLHKAGFNLGFPVENLYLSKISFSGRELKITGRQRTPISYSAYGLDDSPIYIDFDRLSEEFYVNIPLIKKGDLLIADTRAVDFDFSEMNIYENFERGFVLLKNGNDINYREVNHFVKLLLKRVLEIIKM